MFSSYKIDIVPRTLHFRLPAGTSRGVYHVRRSWFVVLTDKMTGHYGIGECAPLPELSIDDLPDYATVLRKLCDEIEQRGAIDKEVLRPYPSMLLGLETAEQHLKAQTIRFFDSSFSRGESGIRINGLIWMGSYDDMFQQIRTKLDAGFTCLKLKIGAIDFAAELALLRYIRTQFCADTLELRVDANGAFTAIEALEKLKRLSDYSLHSIEQPIKAGQWEEMAHLCSLSPIPIALDEELIPVISHTEKERLLTTILPQYIILKPSLHGGMTGCDEWIALAQSHNIPFWATSALESNVGLNAIAQWASQKTLDIPQGLGTGGLFTDNVPFPLYIEGECLRMRAEQPEPNIIEWLER